MQQGLKGSIAGVVAAATLLAGGILTVPHAMALEADGQYYSSKQPYVAPSEATTASYSPLAKPALLNQARILLAVSTRPRTINWRTAL